MSQPQSSNQGFFETCIGVIFVPLPTMQTIVRRRPIGWALIVIIVIAIAQGITGAASLDPADFDDVEFVQGPLQGFSIVGGPALAIVSVAFFTAICWIMSRILGGKGSYGGLFAGFGFAYLPAVFTVPVTFMALQLDSFAQGLSGLVGFGIAVWTIVLSVFAIRENNNFSTGRAIAALFIPLAVFFVLLLALFAFVVIMILIALNDGFAP
ncbi:MAG: Yip1 family protein [Chloroflexota bacterium]|nr:Yip1 family protein [Chloroflexota bacterium]